MEPDRIRSIRERHRLTQRDFASVLGVRQSSVSFWETGERFPTAPYVALMEQMEHRLDTLDEETRREKMREDLLAAGLLGVGALMVHLFSGNDDE